VLVTLCLVREPGHLWRSVEEELQLLYLGAQTWRHLLHLFHLLIFGRFHLLLSLQLLLSSSRQHHVHGGVLPHLIHCLPFLLISRVLGLRGEGLVE
jgi:hypothetical protein